MSREGSEDRENPKEEPTRKPRFKMQELENVKKLEEKEIFIYIQSLHEVLKKKDKKLKKYKEKIKKLVKKVTRLETANKATEVEPRIKSPGNKEEQEAGSESVKENTALSLVDEIRQAAEQAQNLNGFIYEPTSGLYFDQKTGYYYNAEYGLYYDGNTGCYYKYDQEKNEFEFHSQVSVTESTAEAPTKTSNGNDIFDKYTIADDEAEWGVDISELRQQKRNKENISSPTKRNASHTTRKSKRRRREERRREERRRKHSASESDFTEDTDNSSNTRDGRSGSTHKSEPKDIEDGELDSSSNSGSGSNDSTCCEEGANAEDGTVEIFNRGSRFQDIAKKYPPPLRIIVLESQQEALKVGSLSLITFKGGTLGREGQHDVIIPDINVSKFHLKFIYDNKRCIYKCTDLGSRNGTLLNGTRMSTAKMESDPRDLVHGSIIQIGTTKLLCHVHEGNSTCGQCEPGLLIEEACKDTPAATVTLTRREQLKKIQKKYGLENEKFIENKVGVSNYNDRAAARRIQVGSTNENEKTESASVNTAISSENKGFKMLSKLGWNEGEALGKAGGSSSSGGLLEPINVTSNEGKKGLGSEESHPAASALTLNSAAKTKLANLKKTQERYQKTDIFRESDNESN